MSAAHTPGPWSVGVVRYAGRTQLVCAYGKGFVCEVESPVRDGEFSHGEREANARLIAAAPELCASTEETHAWVRRIQDVMAGYLVPDGYDADEALNKLTEMLDGPEQREIQGRAFAALAKAKGGDNGRP